MTPILFELLDRSWYAALSQLVAQTDNQLLIAAPYITSEGSRLVLDKLSSEIRINGHIQVLTDLSPLHVCDGSLEPTAICALYDSVPSAASGIYLGFTQRYMFQIANVQSSRQATLPQLGFIEILNMASMYVTHRLLVQSLTTSHFFKRRAQQFPDSSLRGMKLPQQNYKRSSQRFDVPRARPQPERFVALCVRPKTNWSG